MRNRQVLRQCLFSLLVLLTGALLPWRPARAQTPFQCSPNPVMVGQLFSCSGPFLSSNSTVQVVVNFGDGSGPQFATSTSTGVTTSHIYQTPGTYSFNWAVYQFTVLQSSGSPYQVTVIAAPGAAATPPTAPPAAAPAAATPPVYTVLVSVNPTTIPAGGGAGSTITVSLSHQQGSGSVAGAESGTVTLQADIAAFPTNGGGSGTTVSLHCGSPAPSAPVPTTPPNETSCQSASATLAGSGTAGTATIVASFIGDYSGAMAQGSGLVNLVSASSPATPNGLQATALGQASIRLDWTRGSSDEDGFAIYTVDPSSGDAHPIPGALTAAGVTTYTLVGLAPATVYCVEVYAFNGAGYSDPSNQACAATSS